MSALIDKAMNHERQVPILLAARTLQRYFEQELKGLRDWCIEGLGDDDNPVGREMFAMLDYIAMSGRVWNQPNALWAIQCIMVELDEQMSQTTDIRPSDLTYAEISEITAALQKYQNAYAMAGRLLALAVDTRKQVSWLVEQPKNSDVIR